MRTLVAIAIILGLAGCSLLDKPKKGDEWKDAVKNVESREGASQ